MRIWASIKAGRSTSIQVYRDYDILSSIDMEWKVIPHSH